MDKQKLKLIINPLMLLFLIILIVTGFLMHPISFRLGFTLRGSQIVQIHDISSVVFTILILIHLYLNLGWFKQVLFRKKRK